MDNVRSETSEIPIMFNSLKTKSKKKKSKTNNAEEKSDTAKKKSSKEIEIKTDVNEKKKNLQNNNNNSALPVTSSDEPALGKPLPKVEDWFGEFKNCDTRKKNGEKKKSKEIDLLPSDDDDVVASSSPSNLNFSVLNNLDYVGTSKSNVNLNVTVENLSKNLKSNAPPGFDNFNGCFNNNNNNNDIIKKPPPGFTAEFSTSNGLTFTNSCGQSFAIPTEFEYTPPIDFEKRNSKLISKVNKIISNEEILDNFRKKSILFRQSLLSAKEYYEHCVKILGDKNLQEIFPELLVLLPDINKQQELYIVFSLSPNFPKTKIFDACINCHQILSIPDVEQHMFNHSIEQNFPLHQTNTKQWTK